MQPDEFQLKRPRKRRTLGNLGQKLKTPALRGGTSALQRRIQYGGRMFMEEGGSSFQGGVPGRYRVDGWEFYHEDVS